MTFKNNLSAGILVLGLITGSPSFPQASNDKQIQVKVLKLKKGTIKVGMSSDEFVKIVSAKEIVNQVVKPDPANPSSLVVRKDCKAGGREFTVILARETDPGPYIIISILTKK